MEHFLNLKIDPSIIKNIFLGKIDNELKIKRNNHFQPIILKIKLEQVYNFIKTPEVNCFFNLINFENNFIQNLKFDAIKIKFNFNKIK